MEDKKDEIVDEQVVIDAPETVEDGAEETPLFMAEEGEETAPVSAIIKLKSKLKGKISERDEEIERLRKENEQLKTSKPVELPKQPLAIEFDTDDEYQAALTDWLKKRDEVSFSELENRRNQQTKAQQQQQEVSQAVEQHYERAAGLVEKYGVDPEVYRTADATVRATVEKIRPGQGDVVVDLLIANLGEGSEKVTYYLGKNSTALNQFRALLHDDPSGLKASVFLGKLSNKLEGTIKKTSRAPAPAASASGSANVNSGTLKKQYDKAHKSGNTAEAFEARRAARKAGIDTSQW